MDVVIIGVIIIIVDVVIIGSSRWTQWPMLEVTTTKHKRLDKKTLGVMCISVCGSRTRMLHSRRREGYGPRISHSSKGYGPRISHSSKKMLRVFGPRITLKGVWARKEYCTTPKQWKVRVFEPAKPKTTTNPKKIKGVRRSLSPSLCLYFTCGVSRA